MRDFFRDYFAIPLSILLFLLIAPSIMLGGFTLAFHLAGFLPDTGICHRKEK